MAPPPRAVGRVEVRAMAEPAAGSTGRIFISYRREETAYPAGWLFERLAEHFGHQQVFKDVDSIELGDDFVQMITRAVGSCDVLLALIGDQWLTITDVHGRRRLDDPDDFVRLEIEAALTRNVRIIPILVDGANMPRADELPAGLAGVVRRQALELSPSRFEYDTSRLLKVLETTLADVRTAQEDGTLLGTPAGAAGQSTRAVQKEPPGPLKQTQQGHRPTESPTASLTSAMAGPESERREPSGKPRQRLSTRAWILTGVGGGVALILMLIVATVAILQRTPSANEDAAEGRGTTEAGGGIEVDTTPKTSPDGVRLTGLEAVSRRDPEPPLLGDTVTVRYSLTNVGDKPIELEYTFLGVRNPADMNKDKEIDTNQVLAPGETINAQGGIILDSPGTWQIWPCYGLSGDRGCPDKWQAFSVLVK
jgi:hypothetical protein